MPSAPLSSSLIGSWELISRIDHTPSGERRIEPTLGEDPVALLIYDGSGHFAAQFMRRDRSTEPASTGPAATGAARAGNNTNAVGGYDAYFGTYTIDDANCTVTQTLTAALSPGNVGQVLTRKMNVEGDALTIEIDMTTGDGEAITRTLTWVRVG